MPLDLEIPHSNRQNKGSRMEGTAMVEKETYKSIRREGLNLLRYMNIETNGISICGPGRVSTMYY